MNQPSCRTYRSVYGNRRPYGRRSFYGRRSRAAAAMKHSGRDIFILAVSITAACLLAILISMTVSAKTVGAGTPDPGTKYYKSITVEYGDSLWSIAGDEMTNGWDDTRDYISEVMQINGLRSESIHAGSHLIVPYYER